MLLDFMALATHIETNEVSIKDILGPSDNASAFRPKQNCLLFPNAFVYPSQCLLD